MSVVAVAMSQYFDVMQHFLKMRRPTVGECFACLANSNFIVCIFRRQEDLVHRFMGPRRLKLGITRIADFAGLASMDAIASNSHFAVYRSWRSNDKRCRRQGKLKIVQSALAV
mmetsp:Transcript_105044/g.321940  ORF Transcript_105044/g.321940 Transcript_105044/m.321940 type:complete len:113 (-) Transcript_105044:11-349(-)